jgi:hypothetical protein
VPITLTDSAATAQCTCAATAFEPTSGATRARDVASMRQAARFADAALRRVLEVIDRRRSISQLNGLLAAGLVDSVLSANRAAGADGGVAVLRRVRLQAVGSPDGFAAAEVFGSYSRGRRMHAIACRIERMGSGRWQVVARASVRRPRGHLRAGGTPTRLRGTGRR